MIPASRGMKLEEENYCKYSSSRYEYSGVIGTTVLFSLPVVPWNTTLQLEEGRSVLFS